MGAKFSHAKWLKILGGGQGGSAYSVDITPGEQTLYGVGASGTLVDNQADKQDPSTYKIWVYDKDSNVTSHTDQNGTLHGFTYDGGHRRTRVTITPASPNTHNIEGTTQQDFHYDGLGRQTYALDNNGAGDDVINRWQYDLLSRTLQESTQIGSFPERVQSWQYDGSQTDAGSGAPTAQFYADGRRLFYAYDANDRIKSLTDDLAGASPIAEYKYVGPGTRTQRVERGNGVDLVLDYDDIRRRTDLTEFSTSNVHLELIYGYDAEHQPKFEANLLHGNASEIYSFDSAGRVTTFGRGTISTGTGILTAPTNLSGVTQVRAFKLDGVHNWEQTVTLTDNVTAVEDREHTNFNEIHKAPVTTGPVLPSLPELTYDDQGNLLRRDYPAGSGQRSVTYHWDGLNRLREVKLAAAPQTTLASYLHATGNQRVARTVNDGGVPSDSSLNGTTHFYYAGWQLCDEYKIFFGNESPWYQYVWGPRHADELVVRDERRGGSTLPQLNDGVAGAGINNSYAGRQYQHHDRGWDVRAVTDEAGTVLERYVYDPHGKPFTFAPNGVTLRPSTTIDQSYGYTNQRYDRETGLWYFKHRYLDDGLGRFVSRDPAGYVDGMNMYTAYFALTGTDPLGLFGLPGFSYAIEWANRVGAKVDNAIANQVERVSPNAADKLRTFAAASRAANESVARSLDSGRSLGEAVASPIETKNAVVAGVKQKASDVATVYNDHGVANAVAELTSINKIAEGAFNADISSGQTVGDGFDRFVRIGEGTQSALNTSAALGGGWAGGTKLIQRLRGTPGGIVYGRTDPTTGEPYVGQTKSPQRFDARQGEHDRKLGVQHDYSILDRAEPGIALDVAEESAMRRAGGIQSEGGTLANKRHQMSEERYREAGGDVDDPNK